jgi:REP element-mobilizing transposase RayT
MGRTLGYHWVKSGFGLWLPGDDRGHWSEAWDAEIGFIEPHTLHARDPVRKRMAEERMFYPPVRATPEMLGVVESTLADCMTDSDWRIAAASLESTHIHVLLTATERDIDNVLKWLAQETTKAVHKNTSHTGPVWCKGRWRQFIFDQDHWDKSVAYIERHNIRRGVGPRPYSFLP